MAKIRIRSNEREGNEVEYEPDIETMRKYLREKDLMQIFSFSFHFFTNTLMTTSKYESLTKK